MSGDKRHNALDRMLDLVLAVCANPDAPPEMEERILARLARKKAKSQRKIRAACVALAVALLAIVVLQPIDLARPGFQPFDKSVATSAQPPNMDDLESKPFVAAEFVPVTPPDIPLAETAAAPVLFAMDEPGEESLISTGPEESLISDFEVEPLTIAALELPALASR